MAMTDAKRILAGTSEYSSNIKLHLQNKVIGDEKSISAVDGPDNYSNVGKGQFVGT
jgi:hypothetical protein